MKQMWFGKFPSQSVLVSIFVIPIFLQSTAAFCQEPKDVTTLSLDQLSTAREAASISGRNLSTELNVLISSQGQVRIGSMLSTSLLGLTPTQFASSNSAEIPPAPDVAALGTYQRNIEKSLVDAASAPVVLRVWEGQRVELPDVYPETVLIAGNGGICSGTLVTPRHVITAAHCFCKGVAKTVIAGTTVANVIASADVDDKLSYSHIPCDNLASNEGVLANINKGDFALYTLKTPINILQYRAIATDAQLRAAAAVRAVGFGTTPSSIGGVKFIVDIQIASYDCHEPGIGAAKYGCSPSREMIARGLNRDTCGGDSGGPLYVLGADVKLYLAALTSRSLSPDGSCGLGGIYVKLTQPEVREWLISHGVPGSIFSLQSEGG